MLDDIISTEHDVLVTGSDVFNEPIQEVEMEDASDAPAESSEAVPIASGSNAADGDAAADVSKSADKAVFKVKIKEEPSDGSATLGSKRKFRTII